MVNYKRIIKHPSSQLNKGDLRVLMSMPKLCSYGFYVYVLVRLFTHMYAPKTNTLPFSILSIWFTGISIGRFLKIHSSKNTPYANAYYTYITRYAY